MEKYPIENLTTQNEILAKLRAYKDNPDDLIIRYKEKIRCNLLNCPELLWALGWEEYEQEIITSGGTINTDGDRDVYYNNAIKPALFIPDAQDKARTYLCYTVNIDDPPFYASRTQLRKTDNKSVYFTISFIAMSHYGVYWEPYTQIPRHDLICSIIRERFNWSNIFGFQCSITSDKESSTDTNYITRTMVLQGMTLNGVVNTISDKPYVITNRVKDSETFGDYS